MKLWEIEKIPAAGYLGGKRSLEYGHGAKQYQKLPGGSGLLYTIDSARFFTEIKLYDPQGPQAIAQLPQIVGQLELKPVPDFPLPGSLMVNTITVDEDYRSQGLAKAMYGIVLSIMRRPLIAGGRQTPGGRQNWVSLSQIPGVEVRGFFELNAADLNPMSSQSRYINPERVDKFNREIERTIETIMGKIGAEFLGTSRSGRHYFAFDVLPGTTGKEMEAYVKTRLTKVYINYMNVAAEPSAGLYAVWTGR